MKRWCNDRQHGCVAHWQVTGFMMGEFIGASRGLIVRSFIR